MAFLAATGASTFVAGLTAAGRPVLMAGTACSAVRNALSDSAARALIPARSNSLFLAGCASLMARCFSSSKTTYSVFGMVKLSRTSLGFLTLTGFAATAAVLGFVAAVGALMALGLIVLFLTATVFTVATLGALALGGATLTVLVLATTGLAADGFSATSGAASVGEGGVAGVLAILDAVVIDVFPLNGLYSLYGF
jgi:hypothetical protein